MKIMLIAPPFGEQGRKSPVAPVAPPALEYLAGLTSQINPEYEIELVDANYDDFDPDKAQADLIGFTVHTVQAPWVYRTADRLRRRGLTVIFGGIHITALPGEAAPHADALVLGEAEAVWPSILRDLEKGCLKNIYRGEPLSLVNLPQPRTDLFTHKYMLGSFFTARGCPHRCRFCSVHKFFGGEVRYRPISEVVREVSASKRKLFWNLDDNCWGTNVARSIELYREMAGNIKGKYWFGMGDLKSLDHPDSGELLKWAQKSGLTFIRVGWESNNPDILDYYKAHSKQGRDRIDAVKRIRAAGIDVMLFVVVGSLRDTRHDFENIIRLSEELDITVRPVMLTPLPDTDLFDEYRDYIFPDYDWDKFNGFRAVFDHPTMTPQEREQTLTRFWRETYTLPKILHRVAKISLQGFPAAHMTSFMIQFNESRPYKNIF